MSKVTPVMSREASMKDFDGYFGTYKVQEMLHFIFWRAFFKKWRGKIKQKIYNIFLICFPRYKLIFYMSVSLWNLCQIFIYKVNSNQVLCVSTISIAELFCFHNIYLRAFVTYIPEYNKIALSSYYFSLRKFIGEHLTSY